MERLLQTFNTTITASHKDRKNHGGRRDRVGADLVLAINDVGGKNKSPTPNGKRMDLVLAVEDANDKKCEWILDSGSSRHLVNDEILLEDARDCSHECNMADGETLSLSKVGSVRLCVMEGGKERTVKLTDVYLATQLERNIVSYGKLELEGFGLVYDGATRALVKRSNRGSGLRLDNAEQCTLRTDSVLSCVISTPADVLMAILFDEAMADSTSDTQSGTLTQFHQRLGHLSYDTVERMAKDPASGIKHTDRRRLKCLSCAEGKQTKNAQSRKDTSMNSPIDWFGGGHLLGPEGTRDAKGPPRYRYLVNFVDHKSNYCRVYLDPTKDRAEKKFEHFLVFFEGRFNCRIHVLRTDSGGEY
ncbi:unnamed protein product [Peronospora farinosa]|uniref:Retrovirus-related Pol polyprotein from transposon TNT 1-94-like beta-barrel domain-containing protein n=1 Tax=Peronospora farinosa TaxID=134698 RepID=A0AAV0UI65_9STRA|nr:unnamed protein product [Peronospora farinosa]